MEKSGRIEKFITYGEMARDAERFASSLPPVAAVAGIPRSGLMAALVVGQLLNVHVLTVRDLEKGRLPVKPLRRGNVSMPSDLPILVLDDSVRSGKQMTKTKAALGRRKAGRDLIYGALYARDYSARHVDVWGKLIPRFSTFAWNWRHDSLAKATLYDLDGVICEEEKTGRLIDARPVYVPTVRVRAIVTGRGEHLRETTEKWLAKWKIPYGRLLMAPSHPDRRDGLGGPAGFKARVYSEDPEARLFVESHAEQAEKICQMTGRPVLCTENWKLYGGR